MRKIDCLVIALHMVAMPTLYALPKGGRPVEGAAEISYSKQGKLEIKSQNGTIINWDEFSVDQGELVRFIQENAKSAVFNRVVGKLSSNIAGTLESNGHVFLINPNGVTVHKDGVINTAGFLATSLDFDGQKFLRGEETPFQGEGSVINLGCVTATEGDVYLLGMHVDNQGSIHAPAGSVFMGAAQNIILNPSRDKGIFVVVTPAAVKNEGAALTNQGMVEAVQVQMKADGNPYTFAIQDDGMIAATGIHHLDGVIVLTAESGSLIERGTMTAKNASGTGGVIHILGDEVHLLETATVDASGALGGGTVLVGGDYQGNNPEIRNSQVTLVEQGVAIYADAKEQGDGGKVIVWSDGVTGFHGKVFARGGSQSGDGGFAEVSGKESLNFSGLPDLTAPAGKAGHLLLDPPIFVVAGGGGVLGCGLNAPGALTLYDNTALGAILAGCSVTLQATAGGTITITDPVSWASANSLTLIADSHIHINNSLTNTSPIALGVCPAPVLITLQSLGGDVNIGSAVSTVPVGVETVFGGITVSAPLGNVNIVGGSAANARSFIGAFSGITTGDLFVEAGQEVAIRGGSGNFAYAGIGRYGSSAGAFAGSTPVNCPYLTTVNAGTNCLLVGGFGAGTSTNAVIGCGSSTITAGPFIGDIVMNIGGRLDMLTGATTAGGGFVSGAAVIGSIVPPIQGDIIINVGGNLYMHNSPTTTGFIGCQIGGATPNPDVFAWDQNIFINVGRNMTMDARTNQTSPGNGGFICVQPFNGSAGPPGNGLMFIHVGGDLVMLAGEKSNDQCYMLLHSERFTTEVWVGGNIRCFNGLFHDAAFPVPFTFNDPLDVGLVDVRAGGNIVMGGGNRNATAPFVGSFSTRSYVSRTVGPCGTVGIYFQADAAFAPGQLWPAQTVAIGPNPNIFTGTPLAVGSTNISTVAPFGMGGDGLGGFTLDTARYNISTISGFPVTLPFGDFTAPILSPNPPVAPFTAARNAISYQSTGTGITILSADRYSDGSPCDLLLCSAFPLVTPPYNPTGLGAGLPNRVGVASFGNITIGNFRNITLDAGGVPVLNGGPSTVFPGGTCDILMIANNNILMNANTSIRGNGTVNLVVDNQGPVPPTIGGVWSGAGQFIMDPTAFITSVDELRIFTVCPPFNSVLGLLNGVPFVPGTFCINTNTERWGIWFFDPFFVADYTLFYKCTCLPEIIGRTTPPVQEFLIGLNGPSEYLEWLEQFSESYSKDGYKMYSDMGTSFEFADDEKYMIRLKKHRINNPKSYTVN